MNSVKPLNSSVHVFGLGVRLIAQMTLESNYLLQQMEQIFHTENDRKVGEYIASIGVQEVNLRHLYEEGKLREQAYQEICDTIVESAKNGNKCAYLTAGNPAFLNTVIFRLRQSTAQYGIPFFVYAGVSSFDTLLTDILLPIGSTGIQCFEATHFVRMRPNIDTRVPLALFQPAVVEAHDVRYLAGAYLPGVKILQDVLVELYGSDRRWILLRSAMSTNDNPVVSTGVLSELVEKASDLELGTLLVPGDWGCRKYLGQIYG
jgi:uncharacterized protein YabN with tetrapyrrole methylase and pyrophosphatase domain